MVKDINITKVDIYLKDGTKFLNKDIPQQPLGDHDRFVSFIDNAKLMIFPLDMIECCKFYEGVE